MILEVLQLFEYRNFRELEIGTGGRGVAIWGANGRGKTNILEAIFLLGTTRSHRTRRDPELVRFGESAFRVAGTFRRGDGGKTELSVAYERGGRKRGKVNDKEVGRLSEMVGRCGVVLVSPEDVEITGGEPDRRRQFLDLTLCSVDPVYLGTLQELGRVLKQRGAILRDSWELGGATPALLEPWDRELARAGHAIASMRAAAIESLAPLAEEAYGEFGGGERFSVEYRPGTGGLGGEEELFARIVAARDDDLRRKRTTVGPHRDDVALGLDGRPIRSYGSRGQHRTAVLSLKTAAAKYMRERLGEEPILLLDDVFTELDAGRSERLAGQLRDGGQIFATGTERAGLDRWFPDAVHVSVEEGGRVSSDNR